MGVISLNFVSLQRGGANGVPNKKIKSLSRRKLAYFLIEPSKIIFKILNSK